ncbi:hypothetical protein CGRA01v4_12861 [Colletotrichum graminicola]|nr:hypothetical protein CGRA01v4_12861 [Colletotrichum graminicola]
MCWLCKQARGAVHSTNGKQAIGENECTRYSVVLTSWESGTPSL